MRNGTDKPTPARRGRPRGFDEAEVLARITALFWQRGFSATSLDDLARASGLGRPSLYAAFGDKQAMYLAALAGFVARMDAAVAARRARAGATAADQLGAVFDGLLELYLAHPPDRAAAQGCLVIGTAPGDALEHPPVRTALRRVLEGIDQRFRDVLADAHARGELAPDADLDGLAAVLAATAHSLAVRARAGEGAASLRRLAATTIGLVIPARAGRPARRRR